MYKVCHIADGDHGGGALQAAFKLHRVLRELGIDSGMCVARKISSDPSVHSVTPKTDVYSRLRRRICRDLISFRAARYARTKSRSLETFTQGYAPFGPDLLQSLPEARIYNIHSSSEIIDLELFIRTVGGKSLIVWRLPDQYAMTGGCHFTYECRAFYTKCGLCPQLGSDRRTDLSTTGFVRKERALKLLPPQNVKIVTPSKWLAAEASQSALLRRFEIVHIPTGVDTKTFSPRDRSTAREILGLPQTGKVVLFGAASVSEYRKGLDLLLKRLNDLQTEGTVLATFGHGKLDNGGVPTIDLGYTTSARHLSYIYSAADLFVLPTRADNLPNVVLEAMSCGTPVVTFDVGGLPDVVRPGQTGLLARPGDAESLFIAIRSLLSDETARQTMAENCRALMVNTHDERLLGARYNNLYDDLIAANKPPLK